MVKENNNKKDGKMSLTVVKPVVKHVCAVSHSTPHIIKDLSVIVYIFSLNFELFNILHASLVMSK